MAIPPHELLEHYDDYCIAAREQPIFITHKGKDDLVMLSVEEYRRLLQCEQDLSSQTPIKT